MFLIYWKWAINVSKWGTSHLTSRTLSDITLNMTIKTLCPASLSARFENLKQSVYKC